MKNKIFNAIDAILKNNQQKLRIPLHQKAKFERWLQIELAAELFNSDPNTTIECPCPNEPRNRADISSNGYLIELKTLNTNYKCPQSPGTKSNIGTNIKGAIKDINKIRYSREKGIVAFVFFPMPDQKSFDIGIIKKALSHTNFIEKISCGMYYIFVAEV